MNRYLKYMLIFFVSFTIFLSTIESKDKYFLKNKTIVIDPGHGYLDPGTVYKDIYEKDINLKIGLYLKDELEKNGANVLMTRDDDYDLASANAVYRKKSDFDNRIRLINDSNADLYLSIHLNYLDNSKYSGPQVFYLDSNIYLAKIIQDNLNKSLNEKRKIKLIPSSTYMYNKLTIPGVLIECGFLSNSVERNKLISDEYQKKIALIIVDSLVKYYK